MPSAAGFRAASAARPRSARRHAPVTRAALVLAVLGATAWPAADTGARQLMRCEDPAGRVTYTDADCPDGTRSERALAPPSGPTAEQKRDARAVAERERHAADLLRRTREAELRRLEQERAAQRKADAQRKQDCERLDARARILAEDLAAAERKGGKGREALETRLRRAREDYDTLCRAR